MSTIDDVRKAIQDFIAPELRTITAELQSIRDIMNVRFDGITQRFNALEEKLELSKRIEAIEHRIGTEERKAS